MQTLRPFLILTLILFLTLLSTTLSATSCPNDAEARAQYDTLISSIQGDADTPLEKVRKALALKIAEVCAVRDQRNKSDELLNQAQTDRDRQASRGDEFEKVIEKERKTSDDRLVDNVKLIQRVDELEKRPSVLLVGSIGAAIGVVATVATFFTVKALTP